MTARVLIVDDDPVYRMILSKVLAEIPGVEMAGTAATLAIARHKISSEPIDLVTLDVVLNGESGLDLLPWIRQNHPGILTALVTAGSAREACKAVDGLLLGASTLILKPLGPDGQQELTAALTRVISEIPKVPNSQPVPHPRVGRFEAVASEREVIAVGASTGGPPVVLQFLKGLPRDFNLPILLTQHMPALHVPYFAELLARESGRDVRLAHHGEVILARAVYVACSALHMKIARQAGGLVVLQDDGPEEHHCKPAVDPLFRSVAQTCGAACVGVVMTGMGSDGALGAVALRDAGAPVVVQDKATSVVWGMPGAVAIAGAASEIVPAAELAAAVLRRITGWNTPAEARAHA